MKKYLVLGGSGFIGRHIVESLCTNNHVIVADVKKHIGLGLMNNVEFIELDFINTNKFDEYLSDVDEVIHLISTLLPEDGTENIAMEIEQNIFPTIKLLDSMVRCNIKKILFISSGGTVYGEGNDTLIDEHTNKVPICKYGICKSMIEEYLHLYYIVHGIDYRIARLANPYSSEVKLGKRQGLIPIVIEKILSNQEITIWGDGENIRDYIYIDDAIKAILLVNEYVGSEKIFNIGSGKGYSTNEVIEKINEKLGERPLKIKYTAARNCDVKNNVLDISLIKKCVGWQPGVDIDLGIETIINGYEVRGE